MHPCRGHSHCLAIKRRVLIMERQRQLQTNMHHQQHDGHRATLQSCCSCTLPLHLCCHRLLLPGRVPTHIEGYTRTQVHTYKMPWTKLAYKGDSEDRRYRGTRELGSLKWVGPGPESQVPGWLAVPMGWANCASKAAEVKYWIRCLSKILIKTTRRTS